MTVIRVAMAGLVLAISSVRAEAHDPFGAGPSFGYAAYAHWAEAYKKETDKAIGYHAGPLPPTYQLGSRGFTFYGVDIPPSRAQLQARKLVQSPVIAGGIVLVINLPGVTSNELTLDGPVMAKILMGEVKTWNDEQIKKLNPGLALPSEPIRIIDRPEGSSARVAMDKYLSRISPGFQRGSKGKFDVVARDWELTRRIELTPAALGYMDYGQAVLSGMTVTNLINKSGVSVRPSSSSIEASLEDVEWTSRSYAIDLIDRPRADSWPIVLLTYVVIPETPEDEDGTAESLLFLAWTQHRGTAITRKLGYAPLPDKVVEMAEGDWSSRIHDHEGKPLFGFYKVQRRSPSPWYCALVSCGR